ncbi:hypothetical protein K435DRAFT_872151 [Dendrothele bispora CBS 962.96]|uniref:Alpha-L-arabinofuranosidase C-terminal domain-containing protein n=1 Tax=Dendrothele bispora (strain CBS 962.96) TaxID=1314807 RepID=A0A4S8L2C6_DENBC|nr:hypothetical protein K435DRAFT_872151 [Dendrothele bispora CBS 962.96]
MATSYVNNPVLSPKPRDWSDVHVYSNPTMLVMEHYTLSENYAISTNSDVWASTGRLQYPTIQGTVSEAAFMTGLERNNDIVFAATYAPLLNHVSGTQWTPNLIMISFDAGQVIKSTSYYVQQVRTIALRLDRGDEYIPSTLPSKTWTLSWAVSSKQTNTIIIEVFSILTFAINGSSSGGSTSDGGTGSSGLSTGGSSGDVLKYGQW